MSSSGPIIEELPDDYENPPRAAASASAGGSRPAREARPTAAPAPSAADGDGAGLRKGFFDRPAKRKPATAEPAIASEHSPAAPAPAAETPRMAAARLRAEWDGAGASGAAVGSGASAPSAEAIRPGPICEAEIAEVLQGLRARLGRSSGSKAEEHSGLSEGVNTALDELRKALSSTTAPPARWPTSQARSGMTKASKEANSALAEMRSASNDARRMRSGEEKKAMTEMRRITDDVLERVRKVVDLSAPRPLAEEEKTPATVAAFHGLPFTAKLRLIADDRIALGVLASSFAAGVILMLGVLAEVYSAWGCGHSCGQS